MYLRKPPLDITLPKHWQNQKIAGINAGAAFGSAKRWKEEYFAEVIAFLLDKNFKEEPEEVTEEAAEEEEGGEEEEKMVVVPPTGKNG